MMFFPRIWGGKAGCVRTLFYRPLLYVSIIACFKIEAQNQQSDRSQVVPLCTPFNQSTTLPSWLIKKMEERLTSNASFLKERELDTERLCEVSASLLDETISSDQSFYGWEEETSSHRLPKRGVSSVPSHPPPTSIGDTRIPVVTVTEYASPLSDAKSAEMSVSTATPTMELRNFSTTAKPKFDVVKPIKVKSELTSSYLYFPALQHMAIRILVLREHYCWALDGRYDPDEGRCDIQPVPLFRMVCYRSGLVNSNAERVIFLAGTFSSSVLLLLLVTVYVVLKRLRSLVGNSILCLAVLMLTANLLQTTITFLTNFKTICKVAVIALHWVYLAIFMWLALLSFELGLFVHPVQRIKKMGKGRKRSYHALIGFMIPTAVVLTCILVELLSSRIGYGSHELCLIGNLWSSFFGLVIFAILLLPLSLYWLGRTVLAFYDSQSISQTTLARERVSRGDMLGITLMTMKLVITTTSSWLFGFIGTLADNAVLIYLFLAFVSFQGVLCFFAFVCNRRVYRLAVQYYEYRSSVRALKALRSKAHQFSLRFQRKA